MASGTSVLRFGKIPHDYAQVTTPLCSCAPCTMAVLPCNIGLRCCHTLCLERRRKCLLVSTTILQAYRCVEATHTVWVELQNILEIPVLHTYAKLAVTYLWATCYESKYALSVHFGLQPPIYIEKSGWIVGDLQFLSVNFAAHKVDSLALISPYSAGLNLLLFH